MTKLEAMLKYVSEHNAFYQNRIKEYGIRNPLDITQWPVLTRKEIQENRYNMFSEGYKSKYLCYQLIRTTSSGTSGIPINVYWDAIDYYKSMMSLWRKRKSWYGISPSDKKVAFTLGYVDKKSKLYNAVCLETASQLLINAASLASAEAYKAVMKRILDFNPKWLYVQPFILEQLIYYYKKYDIKSPNCLMHIDSVGEILTERLRKDAVSFFNVSIANLYGSEENNAIAYECPHGNMHILEDNVYVEKDAVITNINNHAYPLIRYDQGDNIILCSPKESCKCGMSSSYYISSIEGRTRQSFEIDGVKINAYALTEIIDIVNNQFNGMIMRYSFDYLVSKKKLNCYITICPENESWIEIIISETKKVLDQRLPVHRGLQICVMKQKKEIVTKKIEILTITT